MGLQKKKSLTKNKAQHFPLYKWTKVTSEDLIFIIRRNITYTYGQTN